MIKKILYIIVIYFYFINTSFSNTVIECKNFIGSQVIDNKGKITNLDDGYSGQIIRIYIDKDEKVEPSVEWQGPLNNFKVKIQEGFISKREGWVNYLHYHPDVFRLYTFFWKKSQMSLVETAAQLGTGVPKIKTFIGKCFISK